MYNEGTSGGVGVGGVGVGGASQYVELELSSDDDTPHIAELPQEAEEDQLDALTVSADDDSQPTVRRSSRQKKMPDHFSWEANVAETCVQEPHTLEEVLSNPEKEHWGEAMEKEITGRFFM